MIEVRYTPPPSMKRSRHHVADAKRALAAPLPAQGAAAEIEPLCDAATHMVRRYPLASVSVAAGAAFVVMQSPAMRHAAWTALIAGVRHYLRPAPAPAPGAEPQAD